MKIYISYQIFQKLSEKGVKCIAFGPQLVRMVTHLDFGDEDLLLLEERVKQL